MVERPYIVGNWKAHGTRAMLAEARAIDRGAERLLRCEVALAPPFTLIHACRKEANLIAVGAQDCHTSDGGAHTGDISPAMAKDAGATFVILGHSERRAGHGETSELIRQKAEAALAAGLTIILCVGESAEDRDAGRAEDVVLQQLADSLPQGEGLGEKLTIAYEPVWAIGSGRTPTNDEISAMHAAIGEKLAALIGEEAGGVRILYGGSVNAENVTEILQAERVGGALVGGASLSAETFVAIVIAAASAAEEAAG